MNKIIKRLLIGSLLLTTAAIVWPKSTAPVPVPVHLALLPANVDLGIYYSRIRPDGLQTARYELVWAGWGVNGPRSLAPKLRQIVAKGRTPIVVLEPYPSRSIGSAATLLPDITAGKYDVGLLAVTKVIDEISPEAIIRWGQEMEFPDDKPWACQPPADYIAAWRHVVSKIREVAPNVKMLWSPTGEPAIPVKAYVTPDGRKIQDHTSFPATDYYPGDAWVDYAGLSLFEFPVCTTNWYGHPRSFAEWMDAKYTLVASVGKPVFVSELGVDVSANQQAWLHDAFTSASKYPLLRAIVYYNAPDLISWAKWGAKRNPNWSVDRQIFQNP